jgi:hypothetical protein
MLQFTQNNLTGRWIATLLSSLLTCLITAKVYKYSDSILTNCRLTLITVMLLAAVQAHKHPGSLPFALFSQIRNKVEHKYSLKIKCSS